MNLISADAHNAATTRHERAAEIRNRDVREALAFIRAGMPTQAHRLLVLSVQEQAHLEAS